jgi:thioredoxin reductase (NADPH)
VGVGLELSRRASTDALPSTPAPGISLDIAGARAAKEAVRPCLLKHEFDYDVIVVGGGSGGLAAAREVAAAGGRVMLLDHVEPSPHGTKWGLGGTCVNVGCIPKKLMHQAALLGQGLHDAAAYGWRLDARAVTHDWGALMESVRNYIRGTNWGYRNALRDERVQYVNARARLGPDGHTVQWAGKQAGSATAAHIIVAVGGRPRYPEGVEGAAEYGITR